MEPWVPQWPSPPLGRHPSPSRGSERDRRRDAHYRPQSWHDGERVRPRPELRGNHQTQPDVRTNPLYASRMRDWAQQVPGVDYYEAAYPRHLYARLGLEDLYPGFHPSPSLRDDYGYGSYYYPGHPQPRQEERVPRQGSPSNRREDPRELAGVSEQSCAVEPCSDVQLPPQGRSPNLGDLVSQDLPPEGLQMGAQSEHSLPGESNLLTQQELGLSSSGYELSQYMEDPEPHMPFSATVCSPAPAELQVPMKFYAPHVLVSFGPGGQLVLGMLREGQTARVELHSMEVILNDSEEQEEMRNFSGPLVRDDVHKVDIMSFCQRKAAQSCRADTPRGQDSALLWKLLVLLCRQNGSMVGSDIAELLMQDCKKLDQYQQQPPVANLIGLGDEDWPVLSSGTPNLLTGEIPPSVETPAQIVEKFTKLLYFGRKKEALEWAMKNHLWGHALFLSSKMDPRTYNWVMSGFISTLALNDPLQTLFQLMSGRIPQAATCCGDRQWGDWRPHLAVMLSNQGGDPELHQRAIVAMGDTLASKGLVEAAHFCYLMAHVPFGHYTVKTDQLVLLGSSHSQAFHKFATTEAIQRTETFEYCQALGRPQALLPSFQVYKLLYAARLADYGLASQALHYCEAIGTAMLGQGGDVHPVLLAELIKLTERLKFSDPLLEPRPMDGDSEPDWLVTLRRRQEALQARGARDTGDPYSVYPAVSGARRAGNALSQKHPGHGGDPEAFGDSAVLQPPSDPPGPAWPGSQQPLPFLPGSYSAEVGAGPVGVQVPLYPVPQAPVAGSRGSGAVPEAPAGGAWEEVAPPPGEPAAAPEPFLPLDGVEVTPGLQVTPIPRVLDSLESSAKKEQGEEEEEEEEKSPPNPAAREKQGDGKGNPKGSGFGWFSWFRSKPSSSSSSGEEDPSDSEQETPGAPRLPQPDPGPSLMPSSAFQPLTEVGTFARGPGETSGPLPGGAAENSMGTGGLPAATSSELSFTPGFLLPPPTFQGGVPLYNPAQVPQLSSMTSQNRPNRLAQRRYPTQPAQL